MTSELAIPCSVMNLASRSDAEDSNTFEITGFGALMIDGFNRTERGSAGSISSQVVVWKIDPALPRSVLFIRAAIVSQWDDKAFTLKMSGKRLFRRLFAFHECSW